MWGWSTQRLHQQLLFATLTGCILRWSSKIWCFSGNNLGLVNDLQDPPGRCFAGSQTLAETCECEGRSVAFGFRMLRIGEWAVCGAADIGTGSCDFSEHVLTWYFCMEIVRRQDKHRNTLLFLWLLGREGNRRTTYGEWIRRKYWSWPIRCRRHLKTTLYMTYVP